MKKEDILGTWKCTKAIENGKEKIFRKPKVSLTFLADGTGTFKALFIPLSFRWSLENNILSMFNATDGTEMDGEITLQEDCIVMEAKGSYSYFYR